MTYVRDDVVDAVIARNQSLQEVVQGRRLMLWRPGTTATVIAQCSLMFGGIGLMGSVLWLWPLSVDSFKYGFFFGLLPLAAVTGGVFHGVLRGWPSARTINFRFALVMTALSVCAVVVSLTFWKLVSLASASVSIAFHLAAAWLISGEGYAITSAMFRAQRQHANRAKQMARELTSK
jgi:hypothetical protein